MTLSSRGKHSISTTRVPMATKLNRIVTYCDELQPTKSDGSLNTWFGKTIWQIKTIIFPPPKFLWQINLGGSWLTYKDFYSKSPMTFSSRGLAKLCEKLKQWYLHYHSISGHQTEQDVYLPWVPLIHKVTSTFGHVVFQNQVTNWNHYISPTTLPVAIKLEKMVI